MQHFDFEIQEFGDDEPKTALEEDSRRRLAGRLVRPDPRASSPAHLPGQSETLISQSTERVLQFKVGRLDGHSGPARPPAGAQNDPDIFLFRESANLNFFLEGNQFPAKKKFGANRSGNF